MRPYFNRLCPLVCSVLLFGHLGVAQQQRPPRPPSGEIAQPQPPPQDREAKEEAAAGESKTDPAARKDKPALRNWGPVASLTDILPLSAASCVDALLSPPKDGPAPSKDKETDCDQMSPHQAAEKLIADIKGDQNAAWIIQVLRFSEKKLENDSKTQLVLRPGLAGHRVLLYWKSQKKGELTTRRFWGRHEIRTLIVVAAAGGRIDETPEALGIDRSSERTSWVENALETTRKVIEAKYDVGEWFANRFAPFVDSRGQVFIVPKEQAEITQFLASKKKDPAWLTNVLSLISLAQLQKKGGKKVVPEPLTLYGTGHLQDVPVPSDIWVQAGGSTITPEDWALLPNQPSDEFFRAVTPETEIDNEGKYWFDASVGIPTKKIDELEYIRNDNRIQTRNIGAESVLALANIIPRSIDIKDPKQWWHPRLLIGFGIRGRVLDRAFFGVGMGFAFGKLKDNALLQLFQPYAGIQRTVTRIDATATGAASVSSAWKLAIGINIPVKTATERLSSKKASK
jgi:hypothetical protein